MDEDRRKDIALFKYALIAPVLQKNVKVQMQYFREVSQKGYDVPHIGRRRFKAGTLKEWLRQYRGDGFDALMPKTRNDKGLCRKINDELANDIKESVRKYPVVSCSAIYRLLIAEGKMQVGCMNEGTLRKYIKDNQLKETNPPTPRKKFEKEHVNELWTADCMHGPYIRYGKKKHKVFLIAAIDDRSRVIAGGKFFFHENSISLEIVLKEAIRRFGLPDAIYCDNGSLFQSSHLQLACARLGTALIHSKPYDSPSRGKIERFFRTVRQKFLPFLDIQEIQDINQLNEQFQRWLEKEYHRGFHHAIGTAPMDRFMQEIKQATIKRVLEAELDMAFQITITRKVKNDATVSVRNVLYECPPEFIGKKIQIRYPSDKQEELSIYEDDKPVHRLRKINIHENSSPPAWAIKFQRPESTRTEEDEKND